MGGGVVPRGGGGYAEIGRCLFCPVPHVRGGLGSLFGRHNVAKTECPFFFKFTQSLGPGSLGLQFWHMTSTHLMEEVMAREIERGTPDTCCSRPIF